MSIGFAEMLVMGAVFAAIVVTGVVIVASFFAKRRDGDGPPKS